MKRWPSHFENPEKWPPPYRRRQRPIIYKRVHSHSHVRKHLGTFIYLLFPIVQWVREKPYPSPPTKPKPEPLPRGFL